MDEKSTVRAFPSFSTVVEQEDAADVGLAGAVAMIDRVPYSREVQTDEHAALRSRVRVNTALPGELKRRAIAIALGFGWTQITAVRL
jgi:hypothetical protein